MRGSTSGRWLEKSGKHVGRNFTLKRSTKATSLNSVKQKYKQILVARKKEISDRYLAYLLTQETSAVEQAAKQEKRTAFFKVERLIIYGLLYRGPETIVFPLYGHLMDV